MANARGTKQVEGFVKFPVIDPKIQQVGGGGGMFVKLVVIEPDDYDKELGRCCGVAVYDLLCESFIGDDTHPGPKELDYSKGLSLEEFKADEKAWDDYVEFHFPHYNEDNLPGNDHLLSRHYRASIVMGSTGWGCSYEPGKYWRATYDDLTDDGKALYQMVQKLNPGCTLHLVTFLDT